MPPKRSATQANLAEGLELEASAVSPRLLHAGVTPFSFGETRASLIPATGSSMGTVPGSPTTTNVSTSDPLTPIASPFISSVLSTPVQDAGTPVQLSSPTMAALMRANVSPAIAAGTAPKGPKMKNGKRVTEAQVVVVYAIADGKRVNVGFFVYNVYDKYLFYKGDVDVLGVPVVKGVEGAEIICEVLVKFMYPNRKRALLEAGGFIWPGPLYLPVNTPVWKFIVDMTLGPESVELQSLKIEELRAQTVRLWDGQPDNSNGGVFSVNVTEKELAESEWAMLLCLRG
jgi:hypothetical protein